MTLFSDDEDGGEPFQLVRRKKSRKRRSEAKWKQLSQKFQSATEELLAAWKSEESNDGNKNSFSYETLGCKSERSPVLQ